MQNLVYYVSRNLVFLSNKSYLSNTNTQFTIFIFYIGLFCRTLQSFSTIRNIKTIMSTNVGKRDLRYLHGIRVLSLFWIILLHVAMFAFGGFWPYGK